MSYKPEELLQMDVVSYLEMIKNRYSFDFFYVPNEAAGKINSPAGFSKLNKLKKMGLRSGVSDIVIFKNGKIYFLELKDKKGRQSENQREFEICAIKQCCPYSVARSLEDVVSILRAWKIIA